MLNNLEKLLKYIILLQETRTNQGGNTVRPAACGMNSSQPSRILHIASVIAARYGEYICLDLPIRPERICAQRWHEPEQKRYHPKERNANDILHYMNTATMNSPN